MLFKDSHTLDKMTATEYIPPHLRGLQATAEKSSQAPSTSEPATKPVTAPASLSHLPPHLRGFQQPSKSSVESATPSPPSTYEKVNATPPGNTEKVPAKFLKPYPCTYEECLAGFETLLKLKNHKKDRHDYCGTCDLDFVDDTDLLRHKIDSDKHIVCPVCGQSFRSSNGRDHHVKQVSVHFQSVPSRLPPDCCCRLTPKNKTSDAKDVRRCSYVQEA